jgi:hypothetical protein
VAAGLAFPHAAQAIRIVRRRRPLNNLAITILRLTGATSIAAALRHHARRSSRPLETIINC